MMDHTHIADGIAVELLLIGIVLTGGAVGALTGGPVSSHAAGDAVDGPAADSAFGLLFPIDNLTAASPLESTKLAFPIDNLTVSTGAWGVHGADTGATGVGTLFRVQDMDPYAVPDGSDGLPQDMDPY